MNVIMAFSEINWLSVLLAALSSFFVGGIWYGPLFGKLWMKAHGFTEEELKKRGALKTFGISFLAACIAAIILDMFIGREANMVFGAAAGFFTGTGWVATFLGILYLFEMKSLRLYLINAGFCIVSLTIMGFLLGVL